MLEFEFFMYILEFKKLQAAPKRFIRWMIQLEDEKFLLDDEWSSFKYIKGYSLAITAEWVIAPKKINKCKNNNAIKTYCLLISLLKNLSLHLTIKNNRKLNNFKQYNLFNFKIIFCKTCSTFYRIQ